MTYRRHNQPPWRPRRRRAFALVELLAVVGIMATVAVTVVVLTAGITQRTDRQMIQGECAEIRRAALRFQADMGCPPRLLAEVIQPPDPADAMGGWWWRTTDAPPAELYAFDPATRRGWNGPYVQGDARSAPDDLTCEARLVPAGYGRVMSDPPAGKRLSILLSRYSTYPQAADAGRAVSHYQLDATDPNGLAVRFVKDPLAAPASAQAVLRLDLGVQP